MLDRLRSLPPARLPVALDALQQRGLLPTLDAGPARRAGSAEDGRKEDPQDRLSVKQRTLHRILQDERQAAFYQCAQLWWVPEVDAGSLVGAWNAVAPGYESLRTDVDLGAAPAVLAAIEVVRPELLSVPAAERAADEGRAWVTAHSERALRTPLPRSARSVHATIFDVGRAGSWLLVHGRDLMLDQQGLQQVLGPALEDWLADRPAPVESVAPSDIARWQSAGLRDGLLALRIAARALRLADTPACPLPVRGDRSGRRVAVPMPIPIADVQQAAADAGVSIAAWSLAAWQRAIATWSGTDAFAIGCCSTLRLLPDLGASLGNLTNTVIIPPSNRRPAAESIRNVQRAFSTAISGIDEPFEAVLAGIPGPLSGARSGSRDRTVEDEMIGLRFTFTEDVDDHPLLQPRPVRSGYAKSVLSADVERREDRLVAFVDHRSTVSPVAADRLADLFGRSLAP
ncbi:hypothetical protein SAMN04489812_3336 [Microlunatus soli]|uniref:Condensation domain-containing protein n=1 Tax=Microlunatus soli TaxID=630515 RepID=A0A1H1VSR7_9ACTN|nr:hypothetical protein SAMN04489812_3336 [Microlunatus soli]